MFYSSETIEKVVDLLSFLPTIGKKTALRLTFFLLKQDDNYLENLSKSIIDLKQNVKYCSVCFNYTDSDPCKICSSLKRNKQTICVVEEPTDVFAIEKTNEYNGLYHVLHGALNPLEGVTPNDLKIKELIERTTDVSEIILALNPTVEGEVTTQYLSKLLKQLDIKVSRIARGIPIGTDLEFADEATISRALEGRVEI